MLSVYKVDMHRRLHYLNVNAFLLQKSEQAKSPVVPPMQTRLMFIAHDLI